MNIGVETVLNMIPGGVMPIVYVNQYDTGYQKRFRLYNGAQPFNIASNQSVTIRGTKGDGHGIVNSVQSTVGSNVVTVTITEQMTAVKGVKNIYELRVVDNNGLVIGTVNFIMFVERAALDDNTIISDSDLSYANDVYNNLQSVEAYQNLLNMKIQRYDTAAQMKADSALKNGDYARTGGYYAVNDGGGALYRIYSTAPASYYETLTNGLYARLLPRSFVSPEMFGAYGDGSHDDTAALSRSLAFGCDILCGNGKTYLCSATLTLGSSIVFDLNGSALKSTTRDGVSYVLHINGASNAVLKNGSIVGDRTTRTNGTDNCHCIRVNQSSNVLIDTIKTSEAYADGLLISRSNHITVRNLEAFKNGRNNISVLFGDHLVFENIYTHDCVGSLAPGHGMTIEPWEDDQNVQDIRINNYWSQDNYGSGLQISLYWDSDVGIKASNLALINNRNYSLAVAGNPNLNGFVDISDVTITVGQLTLVDICSDDFSVSLSNVTMRNLRTVSPGGLWSAALLLKDNHYTDVPYKNILIKNVTVESGNHTYLVYCGIEKAQTVPCSNVVIDDVKCISGIRQSVSNPGIVFKNVQPFEGTGVSRLKDNIYTKINADMGIILTNDYNLDQTVEIVNTISSDILIETTSNNLGVATIVIPPKSSLKCKRTGATYWEIQPNIWYFYVTANSSVNIPINDIREIQLNRSTNYELYYVRENFVLQVASTGATGGTVTVDGNTLTIANSTGGAIRVYVR